MNNLLTKKSIGPKKFALLCCIVLLIAAMTLPANQQLTVDAPAENAWHFDDTEEHLAKQWVDSIYALLTQDEKIGQLFMIRAHSNLGAKHVEQVERQIKKYKPGALCFFQGTPLKQAELTNRYQELSKKLPLLISMDAEWGLAMRHKKAALRFPMHMTLGAIQDNSLIYKTGAEIAAQLKRIGVHINFAPVADINNNANNPVINDRSFGEDKKQVTLKSYMFMLGSQDQGVMACAKHYPGHGDTDIDSHLDLPSLHFDAHRLDSLELYPFKILAQQGVGAMMVAHLQIPAWEPDGRTPATLSSKIVQENLIEGMAYDGLIITDAMEMKGVLKHFAPGEAELRALLAGCDILLLPSDLDKAFQAIKRALDEGRLTKEILETKVKKILLAKYKLGLHQYKKIKIDSIDYDLHRPKTKALIRTLYQSALTLAANQDQIIPFADVERSSFASLVIGTEEKNRFQERLDSYTDIEHHRCKATISAHERHNLLARLSEKDRVIIGLHGMSRYPSKRFGVPKWVPDFIKTLQKKTHVSVVLFGNPYALQYMDSAQHVLVAYEDNRITQDLAAQALFGAIPLSGKLPIRASDQFDLFCGQQSGSLRRLGYTIPEDILLDSDTLSQLKELMQEMIKTKAAPGATVLIVRNRKIVYHKQFGHHTYKKIREVRKGDIYDLASITKVAAATLSVMKLVDEGRLDLHTPIGQYLPHIDTTDKRELTLYDIMAHHAGLKPWIPFYQTTMTEAKRPMPCDTIYHRVPNSKYSIQVCDALYMDKEYADSIWYKIYTSELRDNTNYRYSDLGMYMVADIVKTLTGQSIDRYVAQEFYKPLGMRRTGYNPAKRFPIDQIVPTEQDSYFRHKRIQGYVHDMGAAMLGGVSGHAGLFSTAEDLAILFQMLLNEGYYGGRQYLKPETVALFTRRHKRSTRRGIGFDMKELDSLKTQNMSEFASKNTFGHLGFTGTAVWADPVYDLIFIMLANRTYPSMKNNKYGRENFRPKAQTIAYRALKD